jgi:hypothetical protein
VNYTGGEIGLRVVLANRKLAMILSRKEHDLLYVHFFEIGLREVLANRDLAMILSRKEHDLLYVQ